MCLTVTLLYLLFCEKFDFEFFIFLVPSFTASFADASDAPYSPRFRSFKTILCAPCAFPLSRWTYVIVRFVFLNYHECEQSSHLVGYRLQSFCGSTTLVKGTSLQLFAAEAVFSRNDAKQLRLIG